MKLLTVVILSLLLITSPHAEVRRKTFIPHKKNYILPGSSITSANKAQDNTEAKFQISLKTSIFDHLFLAYTQKTFWQVYDYASSSPIRENNYNPQIFGAFSFERLDLSFGYEHESNGERAHDSRSWDRIFVKYHYYCNRYLEISLKFWNIFAEEQGHVWPDTEQLGRDKEKSIKDYYGHGELSSTLKVSGLHLTLLGRYNLQTKKGCIKVDLTAPMKQFFYYHFQFFNGYGESLIDYNRSVTRFGLGIMYAR